jgi:predicted porin
MKQYRIARSVAAGAAALAGLAAHAQSSVAIYGIVDTAVERASNGAGTTATRMVSGQGSASRLGFRGAEDLGSGQRAIFNLEMAMNTQNGSGGGPNGGLAFNRQSWVGLAGNWGQVTVGRQFRPEARAVFAMDPFDAGSVASPPNTYANTVFRADSAVIYETPRLAGFVGRAMYAFGGNPGGVRGALDDTGASLQYYQGPLYVAYAWDSRRNATATDRRVWNTLGGSYDFGAVKLYGAYRTRKEDEALLDERNYWIGLSAPIGAFTLMGTVGGVNDRTAANKDARGWSVGGEYLLSKRTDVYFRYAHLSNKNGAAFGLDNGVNGPTPTSFVAGLRHRF